jgi:hypothetical protein
VATVCRNEGLHDDHHRVGRNQQQHAKVQGRIWRQIYNRLWRRLVTFGSAKGAGAAGKQLDEGQTSVGIIGKILLEFVPSCHRP